MISQAAATDIPMAQPIIPPKIAAARWRKIIRLYYVQNQKAYACQKPKKLLSILMSNNLPNISTIV